MCNCEFPILKTPRLLLRAINHSDAKSVHRNLSDCDTVLYSNTGEPPSLEEVYKIVDIWKGNFKQQLGIRWGITVREQNIVIGSCGYKNINKKHRRAEIGYEIRGEYRRKGLMSEALNAVIKYGFEVIKLNRVEATVNCDNLPSILLLNKLGFSEEVILREYELQQGQFTDLKLFSLLSQKSSSFNHQS
ncbi:MAG: GNAT family N-acetyltransferase [Cyanobacteria bacterium P01_A01_bin.68]